MLVQSSIHSFFEKRFLRDLKSGFWPTQNLVPYHSSLEGWVIASLSQSSDEAVVSTKLFPFCMILQLFHLKLRNIYLISRTSISSMTKDSWVLLIT